MVRHSPTLADLLNQLRGARNRGERPFDEMPFEKLLDHPALKSSASFYAIINKAHHRLAEVTPYDAGEVDKAFEEVESLLRGCAASYARFMGRLTREDDELLLLDVPPPPLPARLVAVDIPVLGTLSAQSNASSLAVVDEREHIARGVGTHRFVCDPCPNIGTLALIGQIAIVALDQDARDGDPVIAICGEKIYARRLCKDARDFSRTTLAADRSGTERVPPTLMLPRCKTRVMPIVGVLYDEAPMLDSRNEAVLVEHSSIISHQLVAAHVIDDSAHPVIRDGDIVLMEAVDDLVREAISTLEGWIVAVEVAGDSGSFGFLKRIGNEVSPSLRIFESIGLNGNSLCIATGAGPTHAALRLQKLARVQGVLRPASGPKAGR